MTHFYAMVWLRVNQIDTHTCNEVTSITLGGVNLATQMYGIYGGRWTPLYPRGSGMMVSDPQGHGPPAHVTDDIDGAEPTTTIPSMWTSQDIFQEVCTVTTVSS